MSCIGAGIDVSMDTLDVALHNQKATLIVTNTPQGWRQLHQWLSPFGPEQVVLEATGGYEIDALDGLHALGLPMVRINPRQARDFAKSTGQLAKTDQLDARTLAHMASALTLNRYKPKDEAARELHEIHRRRQQVVQMLVAERLRRRLTKHPKVREMLEQHIQTLEADCKTLDKMIAQQIEGTLQAEIGASIKGVGPITIATLICEMPELGHVNRKAIAKLYGLAPLARDSGKSRGKRTTWGGRKGPRSAIYMSTLTAIRYEPKIHTFYTRLVESGKPRKLAVNASMRKLVTMLNGRMRDAMHKPPEEAVHVA